jgi:hypothetical protein
MGTLLVRVTAFDARLFVPMGLKDSVARYVLFLLVVFTRSYAGGAASWFALVIVGVGRDGFMKIDGWARFLCIGDLGAGGGARTEAGCWLLVFLTTFAISATTDGATASICWPLVCLRSADAFFNAAKLRV